MRDDRCGSCFDAIANSLRLMFQLYKSGTYWRTIHKGRNTSELRDSERDGPIDDFRSRRQVR
jgi:hypothetical protein